MMLLMEMGRFVFETDQNFPSFFFVAVTIARGCARLPTSSSSLFDGVEVKTPGENP
jgi:hypothetical protein